MGATTRVTSPSPPTKPTDDTVASKPLSHSDIIGNEYRNIKSDYITITEDKLENIVSKFLAKFKHRARWITPFTLGLSLIASLSATNFTKDALGMAGEYWQYSYRIAFYACCIWSIYAIIRALIVVNSSNSKRLLDEIKNIHKTKNNRFRPSLKVEEIMKPKQKTFKEDLSTTPNNKTTNSK